MVDLKPMGRRAKEAEKVLANASTAQKNAALTAIADALIEHCDQILEGNRLDMENGRANGMSESLLDRLYLDRSRIEGLAKGVRDVIALADPCNEVVSGHVGTDGLDIKCIRVPLGVAGIIYEARPNVTSDAAALCLKSGNACILRGGKAAINSNLATVAIIRAACEKAGLPADCVQLVEDTSRESATALMRLNGYLDVLIPRGGAGLIRSVVENSTVPVIETGVGVCHAYVDSSANIDMAANIIFNAKTSRPSVCNSLECMLVEASVAAHALPAIKARLDEKNVVIHGDARTLEILGESDSVIAAEPDDFGREFLDYILACRVVSGLDEALEHIGTYSSGHSECIITESYANAQRFTREVDAAAVYVNASTRYTDGGVFGLGAEIGISTQKLHARGPMGLRQLTSVKYIICGNGQVR